MMNGTLTNKAETALAKIEEIASWLNGAWDAYVKSGCSDGIIIHACKKGAADLEAVRSDFLKDQDHTGGNKTERPEEYTVAFMHGVKCLAEDLAAALPAGSGREAMKSILKANYDYTDQDIESLFS